MDILDILVSQGKVNQETANNLRIDSISKNVDVEELIQGSGLVSQNDFFEAKAFLYNVPFKDLDTIQSIPRDLFTIFNQRDLSENNILPFERKDDTSVNVAMQNPLDIQLIQYLDKKYNVKINPYLAVPDKISNIIKTQSSQQIETSVVEDVEAANMDFENVEDVTGSAENIGSEIDNSIKNAPIVKIVNTVLEYSVKNRASDLHIEPTKSVLRFRLRIDGILYEKLTVPLSLSPAIISRIKILARLKIEEKRLPQDGRFNIKVGSDIIDLRVSSLPTVYGEKIVIRFLRKNVSISNISEIGLEGKAFDEYKNSLSLSKGIILITGPTGSGKTQTLAASLSYINNPSVNILTLEDPVEIEIDGVNQVQVNPDAGLDFATGLRAFLRQDPNIIMVGEIRDEQTARLATQSALTGHLVLSTIHTTSAAGALPRLLDMGIESFLISSTIEVIVAQRLVRKICQYCKEDYVADPDVVNDIKKVLGDTLDITKYIQTSQGNSDVLYLSKGKGCNSCTNTGYLGRTGIFEVLVLNEDIRKLIIEKNSSDDINNLALQQGMVSLIQDGYMKVLNKITTLEEVYRVAKEQVEQLDQ
jgi:type IV pilus assembly protein PilB